MLVFVNRVGPDIPWLAAAVVHDLEAPLELGVMTQEICQDLVGDVGLEISFEFLLEIAVVRKINCCGIVQRMNISRVVRDNRDLFVLQKPVAPFPKVPTR